MKTKYSISFVTIIFALLGMVFFVNNTFAQEGVGDGGIQYPIVELGNCANKEACGVYCDKPTNAEKCLNFAEKNNLMSKEEVKVAKNFIAFGEKGPGGCTSKESCETYCDDISRIDECVSFAEKNNLMPPQELAEAKKIQAAIARGAKPPACGSKKQCDVYCEDPTHMEECINFGAEAGFMQGKELDDAKKMLTAIKKGAKPLPCKGKEACDEFCSTPENMEVCTNFAIAAGFMDEQEQANAQKMLQAVKKGVKPPKCRGKEECDSYCGEDEHFEECLNFAEAAGFMSADDAVMARKTKGKGPGGCKGKEECEAFCNNPDNQEICFNFAKDNGMIPEDELKRMEEGKQGMRDAIQQAPPEVIDCLRSAIGADKMEKIKTGEASPSREIGDAMGACFEKVGPPPGQGGQGEGSMMRSGQAGPGGCTSPESCKSYCESNPEECQKFQPGPGAINPGEQIMPQQSGPGGCKSPEECQSYCMANPEACQNFAPGGEFQDQPPQPPPSLPQQMPPPSPGSQFQPPPQGQYDYPASGQTPPSPCIGEACQFSPMPGQFPGQPPDATAPMPPPSINPIVPPMQPPLDNMAPPIEQQPPMQPIPEIPLPPPTSLNPIYLIAAIPKIISFFLNR